MDHSNLGGEKLNRTITIYSTRGGSGKTITSLGIGVTLAQKSYKTLIIDVDIEAPSLLHLLPPQSKKIQYWTDFLEKGTELELKSLMQPTKFENLDIIYSSSPKMGLRFLKGNADQWWEQALKHSLIAQKQFYEMGYDFIVLDNQSGTSMNSINNLILADISVLVVRPTNYGVGATELFIQELFRILKDMKPREDLFVWNQVPKVTKPQEKELLDKFITSWTKRLESMGLKHAASFPLDMMFNLQLLNDMVENAIFKDSEVGEKIEEFVDQYILNKK